MIMYTHHCIKYVVELSNSYQSEKEENNEVEKRKEDIMSTNKMKKAKHNSMEDSNFPDNHLFIYKKVLRDLFYFYLARIQYHHS